MVGVRRLGKFAVGGAVASALVLSSGGSAQAASSYNYWNVPYGQLYVSAYECNTYVSSCSWYTKVQLRNNGGRIMDRITNTTRIYANGISASVTISKDQVSATLTGNHTSIGQVKWTKYVSNLVELSGKASPSWTTVGITTKACLTGNGPGGYGDVSSKCAQIGLW